LDLGAKTLALRNPNRMDLYGVTADFAVMDHVLGFPVLIGNLNPEALETKRALDAHSLH
jgi:hypothetical protein